MKALGKRRKIFDRHHVSVDVKEWIFANPRCDYPKWLLNYLLEVPFLIGQAYACKDERGLIKWVLVWAFVGDDVNRGLHNGTVKILHISEWNEGHHLWIWMIYPKDMRAPFGLLRRVLGLKRGFKSANLAIENGAMHLP